MKQTILIMGIINGLLGLFCCNSPKDTKAAQKDSTNIQTINTNDILFTTPTLENALPDFEDKIDTSNLQFHEDDWRQIEFISKDQKNFIDQEIAKIKDIYDNFSHKGDTYWGFKKVAVRNLIKKPLTINFQKLKSYLSDNNLKIKGVSLYNNPGQVRNGFSYTANGIDYYGLFDDNKNVKTFCIDALDNQESLKSSIEKLSKLLATEKLYLIDWRQMKVFDETNIKTIVLSAEK